MKTKKLFLMMIAAAAIMFASCSKDSDETDSLAGTTWVEQSTGTAALSFLDKSNCKLVINEFGGFSGTYSYTPPNITILLAYDPDLAVNVLSGTLSGNTMKLSGIDEYGEEHTITFVKR
jgi:hypothetical protein